MNKDFEAEDAKGKHQRRAIRLLAQITQRRIIFLFIFLLVIILIFALRVGEIWWATWMTEHRTRIIGILILAELILGFSAPTIIEANSNPRTLTGPGKNPQMGGDQ